MAGGDSAFDYNVGRNGGKLVRICANYVVDHEKGLLLWEGGLPSTTAAPAYYD